MPTYVALLRGINIGANKRMKMEALRGVFDKLGLAGARTFLQSGNVIFEAKPGDPRRIAARIEAGIEEAFGFHSDVILRSSEDWKRLSAGNPYAKRTDIDPSRLIVLFLAGKLSVDTQRAVQALGGQPEEITPAESEVYIHYPDGMGQSKLDAKLAKVLGTSATARNWNSVSAIGELLEASGSRRPPTKG